MKSQIEKIKIPARCVNVTPLHCLFGKPADAAGNAFRCVLAGSKRASVKKRVSIVSLRKLLLATALCITALSAHAAKSDFTKPVDVTADRSEYNENTGIQSLSGNVEISQGSMLIQADSINVTLKDNKLAIIEGTGSPIIFEQENEQGELVTGRCDSIVYDAAKGILTMLGNASLTQPKQQLKSEKIVFNSTTQSVIAEGGKSGRVSITIQPPSASDN